MRIEVLEIKEFENILSEIRRELDEYEFEVDGIKKVLDLKKIKAGDYKVFFNGEEIGEIGKYQNGWKLEVEVVKNGEYFYPSVTRETMTDALIAIFRLSI